MLELKKTAIAFDEKELMKLERIIIDRDQTEALKFLRRTVYSRIEKAQKNILRCHLDISVDPIDGAKNK
ncbi:MAG: hypothetical protein JSV55_14255 [Deltaproteobacteria bacterium]|nr:MAG: hypothetical protein JSV55_14255 [Deltaproteobacteria bacterium]